MTLLGPPPPETLSARGEKMHIHIDPTLRFRAGFAGKFSKRRFSESDFLRRQYAAIEAFVERFPPDERDLRALAWIEANASRYRHRWQVQGATSERN